MELGFVGPETCRFLADTCGGGCERRCTHVMVLLIEVEEDGEEDAEEEEEEEQERGGRAAA